MAHTQLGVCVCGDRRRREVCWVRSSTFATCRWHLDRILQDILQYVHGFLEWCATFKDASSRHHQRDDQQARTLEGPSGSFRGRTLFLQAPYLILSLPTANALPRSAIGEPRSFVSYKITKIRIDQTCSMTRSALQMFSTATVLLPIDSEEK